MICQSSDQSVLAGEQALSGRTDEEDDRAKTGPASTAYQALERLSEIGLLGELRGKVSFRLDPNERKEQRASGGPSLLAQWQSLAVECPEEMRHTVYVSEMRRLEARQHSHPGCVRRWRKTSMMRTMRESAVALGLDARDMLYWDDYSEGTFIGASHFSLGHSFLHTKNEQSSWCRRRSGRVQNSRGLHPDQQHRLHVRRPQAPGNLEVSEGLV